MVNFAKTETAIRKLFGIFSNKNTTIRCLSKNTICTSEAVMPRSVIKPVKALSTDVVEIQPNRLSLKTKLSSQLEIEHSVLNTISKKEKDIALEIYNCLKDPSFAEIDGVSDILQSFNRNPYNLVEIVKEANSMGLNDPYSIIQRIL